MTSPNAMPGTAASDEFSARLDEHKGIVCKIAHAYARNPEDWQDLSQEIILQLWKSYPRFDPRFKFSTWMYRVALNVAISNYRRERRRPTPLCRWRNSLSSLPPNRSKASSTRGSRNSIASSDSSMN